VLPHDLVEEVPPGGLVAPGPQQVDHLAEDPDLPVAGSCSRASRGGTSRRKASRSGSPPFIISASVDSASSTTKPATSWLSVSGPPVALRRDASAARWPGVTIARPPSPWARPPVMKCATARMSTSGSL
jgi:hypothetical protein